MTTIWKKAITGMSEQRIILHLPKGAQVVAVQAQHGLPCVWYQFDVDRYNEEGTEPRAFIVMNTGEHFNGDALDYRGTFQLDDGNFIGHLFEYRS